MRPFYATIDGSNTKIEMDWITKGCSRVVVLTFDPSSDILHPGRANISKDELREKLSGLYKATKDQVSVFGLRTQFGGGKTTGFALVYDSPEAMKKFEPHYRLVRVGLASKIEKASRQQREFFTLPINKPRLVGDGIGGGGGVETPVRIESRRLDPIPYDKKHTSTDHTSSPETGKQRKNRQKTLRGTAKVKGAKPKKEK
jgi:ribosomal protein S24E